MKTLKKILSVLIEGGKKFYSWSKKQTEYYIGILAFCAWMVIYLFGSTFGIETYPIGYFQKIFFGIAAMSIISAVGFFWLKKTQPYYFDLIDPDTQGGINNLTEWEKIKIGLFWFSFYVGGIVVLASLY